MRLIPVILTSDSLVVSPGRKLQSPPAPKTGAKTSDSAGLFSTPVRRFSRDGTDCIPVGFNLLDLLWAASLVVCLRIVQRLRRCIELGGLCWARLSPNRRRTHPGMTASCSPAKRPPPPEVRFRQSALFAPTPRPRTGNGAGLSHSATPASYRPGRNPSAPVRGASQQVAVEQFAGAQISARCCEELTLLVVDAGGARSLASRLLLSADDDGPARICTYLS